MRLVSRLVIASVFAMTANAVAHAMPLKVTLHKQVLLDHSLVELGDIAEIDTGAEASKELAHAVICKAPRVDYVQRITPAMIELALRQAGQTREILWTGSESVQVSTEARSFSGGEIAQTALSALRPFTVDADYVFKLSHDVGDVNAPLYATELRVRPIDVSALRPHTVVWVDVIADGAVYRSVQVPIDVELIRAVLVARADLPGRATADYSQFIAKPMNIVGESYVLADRLIPGRPFRLARPLHVGQPLRLDAIMAADMVAPGDHVRVTAQAGAIGIEMDGVVVKGGGTGQLVEVKVSQGSQLLTGTLRDDRTVAVQ